jgi:methyl-accepting chemotaxis protein
LWFDERKRTSPVTADIKQSAGWADKPSVRLSLTGKFVLGSLAVAGAASLAPILVISFGIDFWSGGIRFFVALGVGGGLGFFLSRMIGAKFDLLLNAAERIRAGDLRVEIQTSPESRLSDEMDDLAESLSGMLERLRTLVSEVQSTAGSVTASSTGLESSLDRLQATSEEISNTVALVASGVEQEQELLDQASSRMAEVSSEIDLNAGRAREAFGFAAEANQKAGTGVEVARLAIEKMKAVFERAESTGDKVFELEAKTRHVHQITEIITSVAHRTNLLSLNASIEAARAGEAGRGFSVVADEIRKLSESAGRSADEISHLMHEIQADTAMVADEMRQSSQVIGEGREDVNTIAGALAQISMAVSEAARRSEEIFHGADSHSLNAQSMVAAIEEIAKVAGGNGRSVAELGGIMDGQLRTIDEIHHASERVTELAAELEGSLTIFRTGADGHRAPSVSGNTTATRWPDEEIAVRPRREAAPRREPAARAEAPRAKIIRAPRSEPARSPEDRF